MTWDLSLCSLVFGAVCPPIKGMNVFFFNQIKLDIGGHGVWQEQTLGKCAGRIPAARGGEQESVVLLVYAEGLPRAPGDSG